MGMRRKDKEIVDPAVLDAILRKGQVMHLALADPQGQPYVVPLGYGYAPGEVVFHGALKGLKLDLIRLNPQVSFDVVLRPELVRDPDPTEYSMRYLSVIGTGIAEILEDPAEKQRCLDLLMEHYEGPQDPLPPEALARTAVVRIRVTSLTGKGSGYPKPRTPEEV